MDKDGSGSISITEMREAFKKKGLDEKDTKVIVLSFYGNWLQSKSSTVDIILSYCILLANFCESRYE